MTLVVACVGPTLVSKTLLLRQPGHDLLTRLPNGPISVHTRQTRLTPDDATDAVLNDQIVHAQEPELNPISLNQPQDLARESR